MEREIERIRAAYARRKREVPADLYSLDNPGNLGNLRSRERQLLAMLREAQLLPGEGRALLEIGCGEGRELARFLNWGARPGDLHGVDLLESAIDVARRLVPAGEWICTSAHQLPFPDHSFHLVMQFTVFTSILDEEMKHRVAAEMARVMHPDGAIIWYDFRYSNPFNSDVRGIDQSEISNLFPGMEVRLRPVTLAPPLARRLGHLSCRLCGFLEMFSPLCSHYLGLIRAKKQGFCLPG